MSYDNAEPKILKTLNSSGQVLNDSGEVISDASDYWEKVYNEAEPKPDKILHSDGTIKDSSGNLIQDTTEFNVKKYTQAEPIPAKYLHSDGTIDENPGSGGGADLEDNHQTTIDVSTYTEPIEVVPKSGKDGMKKNTVTLSNIPSPSGDVPAYAWVNQNGKYLYFPFSTAPETEEEYHSSKYLDIIQENSNFYCIVGEDWNSGGTYTKVDDNTFTIYEDYEVTYERDSTKDFTLWQVNE